MKIDEIHTEADWERLQPVWNRLVEESASASTFLTWEWLRAWWSAYGEPGTLRVLTASDDAGTIRAIAPLRRQTLRRYGRGFPSLAFIGDGSNDSDYLDFIVERGFEESAIKAFVSWCDRDLDRGVILRLNDLPAGSPSLPLLKRFIRPGFLLAEGSIPCSTVQLPESWEPYLGMLRPRFRTKIRSVLRNLEARPEIAFGWCATESDLQRLLPILFDLHTRRWNEEGKPGVFGSPSKRQFYFDLSARLLAQGALRFSWLEWNGRVLACQYGFVHGKRYLHLQEGYEPASEHWNVGIGLRGWSIQELLRQGVREYDSLAGTGGAKSDWGAEVKQSTALLVANPTVSNTLFSRGPEWQQQFKDEIKKLVPERVLSHRRARLERRVTANGSARGLSGYAQKAAAKCYFHLGLPTAARLVRERYQLAPTTDGRPRRALARRHEAAGRILYYHRVNDERDPFFPATPVAVFERQMRFVARHYTVVSLGDLLTHLDSGLPEPVVAVTFDDGYQDNYQNALPILRRYAIPATIFLATGSIDSRDALWFEQLAGALKTSTREFLDVEADLPRRFWLRTDDERLKANGAVFQLLRHMPDHERQTHLRDILRHLAAPEPQRRDTLVTWDQVRRMKPQGIDFGGHTVTHPYLSRLTPSELAWELSECKRRIETEMQAPVAHFAYPNGRDEDFATWNKEALRSAGYQAAVTTLWGMNYRGTDRMELRRGGPWEDDEALFACKMDWYQLVNG